MKHVYSHYYLLLVFLFMTLQTAQAQNFCYVNSNEILSEMPEVKQADATIETLQKTLQQQLQASADKLQADYRAIQQKAEIGQLSHAQQEEEAKKLHERQNQLSVEEQNMVTQLQKKREELFMIRLIKPLPRLQMKRATKWFLIRACCCILQMR